MCFFFLCKRVTLLKFIICIYIYIDSFVIVNTTALPLSPLCRLDTALREQLRGR